MGVTVTGQKTMAPGHPRIGLTGPGALLRKPANREIRVKG
jgi:hypothetical protein